jgi:cupin 2 domain-containing protein
MRGQVKNIFPGVGASRGAEACVTLFETPALRIERIASHAHSSPKGFWYDQSEDEWVIVLRGAATLEFADGELVAMKEGDFLMIPQHVRHRVERTSEETIWLAVHLKECNRH